MQHNTLWNGAKPQLRVASLFMFPRNFFIHGRWFAVTQTTDFVSTGRHRTGLACPRSANGI